MHDCDGVEWKAAAMARPREVADGKGCERERAVSLADEESRALPRHAPEPGLGEEPRIMRDRLVAAEITTRREELQREHDRTHVRTIGRAVPSGPVRFLGKL
jgi:hypothetical protein